MLHEITFKNNVYNVSYKKRERERKKRSEPLIAVVEKVFA